MPEMDISVVIPVYGCRKALPELHRRLTEVLSSLVSEYEIIYFNQLSEENAIIISEGDYMGMCFFRDLYSKLGLNIYEYTFDEHDRTVAYSLSIPFVSTFVFAAVMKPQDAPGTTFKRHMRIAKGVLSEDDYLLQEILFNPYTHDQVSEIRDELKELLDIIDHKDADRMKNYLTKIRQHIK